MRRMIALVLSLVMALSLCAPAWGADPVEVSDEAGVVAAFTNGGTYKLTKSVAMAENTRLIVDNGVSVTLDLGGNTLSSTNTATATHNFFIDVNGGTLTISNGAVAYTHTGMNMGWNGATTAIDVTDGGVLNMSGVSVTVSGTDMNFAVHMNNWGEVTLNVQNSYLKATYMPVRVFNSGPDMNKVTIENSTLDGGNHSFWVHNYTSADFGGKLYSAAAAAYDEAAVAARLNFDIYGNGNTFITGKDYPVRYGFNGSTYFTSEGISSDVVAKVGNEYYKTLAEAVAVGGTVTMLDDVVLDSTVTVAKDVILDLAGYEISGTCNGNEASMFYINNGVTMTIKDSSAAKTGKVTFASGSSNVGYAFDVEGALVLESGTLELTGSWSIGYVVDVRPNSWGTSAYTAPTMFTMNGGKVVSSDGAIRIASSSVDSHKDVSANFVMNAGEIDAAYDGLFIQQSNAAYDTLNVTVKSGTLSSDLYVVRVYGGAASSVVNGSEKPTTISISGGDFTGSVVVKDGFSTEYMDFAISGGYFTVDPSVNCAEGYDIVKSDKAEYAYMVGKAVAAVDGVNYTSLQDAVDAVADGGTITVKVSGLSAVVSAAKTFTVVYADGVTKTTITAGSGYTLSEKDGVYTVSKYVAPYYPPVTETPAETPAEKPTETPAQTPAQSTENTTPAAPTVEVTVPVVGNENTVKVEATVTGTTAKVDKVDTAVLQTVIGDDVDTGKVTIDFSATTATTGAVDSNGQMVEAAPVDTVEIPAEVVKQIAEAVANPENNAESLEIVLGDGASIEFDAAALAEKVAQAGGEDITISIKPTSAVADTLSQAQIFTLGESVAFDITVTSGGVEISDMGGNITISAPYELAEGETAEGIVVYYVDDAGNREKCETVYDAATGRVSWVTNHLSVYMVSYEAPVEDVTPDDGAVDETPVDDAPQGGSPVLWIVIAVVVVAAIVVAVVIGKKKD